MKVRNEKQRRANRKQIDRLMLAVSNGQGNGATTSALDRRLDADLAYFRGAAR